MLGVQTVKILAIVSSYRRNGNTTRAVQMITDRLREQAAGRGESMEIEILHLAALQIQFCRGCRVCFDRGEAYCPLKDDLLAIKAKMQAADGMILASPVYVEDVNGIMKNWMDRLAHICHRPEFAGKYVYLLTTVGSGSTGHAVRTLNTAMGTWGGYIVGQASFITGASMTREAMEDRYGRQADQIAQKILRSMAEGRASHPSILSLLMFNVQQRFHRGVDEDSLDHAYWTARGWTDPRRTYYIPHHAGAIRTTLARWGGAMVARFML